MQHTTSNAFFLSISSNLHRAKTFHTSPVVFFLYICDALRGSKQPNLIVVIFFSFKANFDLCMIGDLVEKLNLSLLTSFTTFLLIFLAVITKTCLKAFLDQHSLSPC